THVDTALRSPNQQLAKIVVRHEVRIGDVQRPARTTDRQREKSLRRRAADCGNGVQNARSHSPDLRKRLRRKEEISGDELARGFRPSRCKRRLQLRDRWSLEARVR